MNNSKHVFMFCVTTRLISRQSSTYSSSSSCIYVERNYQADLAAVVNVQQQ